MQRFARIVTVLTSLLIIGFGAGVRRVRRGRAPGAAATAARRRHRGVHRRGRAGGDRAASTGRRPCRVAARLGCGARGGVGRAAASRRLPDGPLDARIALGRTATTTLGNAEETADWVRAHQIHSLIVVTAGFHMPRALLELRRVLPPTDLYPAPVQPQAMGRFRSLRTLAAEYIKLIGAWFGVSRVLKQPVADLGRHPVDKSVSF